MALRIDLAETNPRPLVVETEAGDKVRFTFKKRLTRQERVEMSKPVRRGKRTIEVPDLERLYGRTIESIEGVDIGNGGDVVHTDTSTIVRIMLLLPDEIAEKVDDHILSSNEVGEAAGN